MALLPFSNAPGVASIAKAGSTPLTGAVTLTGGTNITLTQSGQNITIDASGGGSGFVSIGDSIGSGTEGSVLYLGAAGVLAQRNPGFTYDGSNLQITGTDTSSATKSLQVLNSTPGNSFYVTNDRYTYLGKYTEISDGIVYHDPAVAFSVNSSASSWLFNMYDGGTIRSALLRSGEYSIGPTIAALNAGTLQVYAKNAAVKGLIVQGAASQTANLQEWQNSSGTAVASIGAGGTLTLVGLFSALAGGSYGDTSYHTQIEGNAVTNFDINNQTASGNLRFYATNHIVLRRPIEINDGMDFIFDVTTGTKIGTATSQKLGFWNVTPVVQQVLATGAAHTVDDVITLLQTLGLAKQS